MWKTVYSLTWFWYYAGPYVPSGVVYGMKEWPSHSHWLVPGFDPDPPIHKMDLYDRNVK